MPIIKEDLKKKLIFYQKDPNLALYLELAEYNRPARYIEMLDSALGRLKGDIGDKGDPGIDGKDGYTPQIGKDYFTKSHIDNFLEAVTPKKGVHYFDGEKGEQGDVGPAGKNGKNGRDGIDAVSPDIESLKRTIFDELEKVKTKKFKTSDLEDFEDRLKELQKIVTRNYGGHQGTTRNVKATLTTGSTYSLSPFVLRSELEVYVGGGRVFFENGDFTTTMTAGNKVNTITFLGGVAADIVQGSTINILGKS